MPDLQTYRADGCRVYPGDAVTDFRGATYTYHSATRANGDGHDGRIQLDGPLGIERYASVFGLHVVDMETRSRVLRAYREDGSEVMPGDTVTMTGDEFTFRAASRVSNSAGTDGMISVTREDRSYTIPVTPHEVSTALRIMSGVPSDQSEHRDLRAILADLDGADHRTRKYRELCDELEVAVRAQVSPDADADELAAGADRLAQTMAPPVPGVTRNSGYVVYSVLEAHSGFWYVAAMRESDGERVTWRAEAAPDGTLVYSGGNYHTRGQSSADEALADLADRAGVFSALDRLSSGVATREAYRESHARVLDELSGTYDVGKARVRTALLEAAALGYARVSWHAGSRRHDYGVRYDRYRCVFTWHRES